MPNLLNAQRLVSSSIFPASPPSEHETFFSASQQILQKLKRHHVQRDRVTAQGFLFAVKNVERAMLKVDVLRI
jgi:hypothetical protein